MLHIRFFECTVKELTDDSVDILPKDLQEKKEIVSTEQKDQKLSDDKKNSKKATEEKPKKAKKPAKKKKKEPVRSWKSR